MADILIGNNGASAEGGMVGLFYETTHFNGVHASVPDILKHHDESGGQWTYPHYATCGENDPRAETALKKARSDKFSSPSAAIETTEESALLEFLVFGQSLVDALQFLETVGHHS